MHTASMDLSNAFNCVDRFRVRQAVRRVTPCLAPWVDFCYGDSSPLLLGTTRLESARGVQQGDLQHNGTIEAKTHLIHWHFQRAMSSLSASCIDFSPEIII